MQMSERVNRFGSESDTALLYELLYAGEFLLKATTAALAAGIDDDREHHRYRLLHGLVRADGIGEWARAIDEALIGPASQHLGKDFSDIRRVLTERVAKGSWQYGVVYGLQEALRAVSEEATPLGDRVALRVWFQSFAELRNKTRGHGALTPATCTRVAPMLRESVRTLQENIPIFKIPWAYLHRNLSGKYRVVPLTADASAFSTFKTSGAAAGPNYPDGVYLHTGKIRRVDLVYTDPDASDFFFPNGAFRNGGFELHSLISDSRQQGDGSPYLAVATPRPASETEGKGELDVIENVFTNIPSGIADYVPRPSLEAEVRSALMNDRHPVVTLVGRGGIGKTSLALTVLRDIAGTERYSVIVWFSARDIDLLPSGAKVVRPRVLTDRDIADEYRTLMGDPPEVSGRKTDSVAYMSQHLRQSPHGPTLFVFDNFETVRSPVDLFQWIDTNIRLPNKAVITTRFRDFKADYPITVPGMEQAEAELLVARTAKKLNIEHIIGPRERDEVIDASDGHPYVMKIVLGEIANVRSFSKPKFVIARKEETLDALFERTYANLSPIAVRIFLTLSAWRSLVPQLAVEAVLMRRGMEGSDPEAGIDQLVRMSLVDRRVASDGTDFLQVPLAAALFGKRKLEVSPQRALIDDDVEFLLDIGATTLGGLKDGIRPRIQTVFRKVARKISDGVTKLDDVRPILEFLARGYPPAWLLLADLQQEVSDNGAADKAASYIRRYLETQPARREAQVAWRRLYYLYRLTGDLYGACGAFLKAAEFDDPIYYEISDVANWVNNSEELRVQLDVKERRAHLGPLIRLMESRLSEATATDLSRLAWMHLHCGDEVRAYDLARRGLDIEPENIHCRRLAAKLSE